MALKIIHTKNLRWLDIVNPDDKDIAYLREHFAFHPLDFEDVVTPYTRPKIDEYDNYHYIILLFPKFSKETKEIHSAEVDFFVGNDFLITIHDGGIKTLTNLVKNSYQYDNVRTQFMSGGSGFLLFSILELLFKRSFPILDTINHDLEEAGKRIFNLDLDTLQRLSRLKTNIIIYRRIMKMHKFVLTKLMHSKNPYMQFKDSKIYFQNLIEYAENIWDVLSSDKETAESYEQTNQSLAAHRMNDILRVLTMFSVIIFLLTLIINILLFAENTTPIAQQLPGLFPQALLLLGLVALAMLLFFKNKKWL